MTRDKQASMSRDAALKIVDNWKTLSPAGRCASGVQLKYRIAKTFLQGYEVGVRDSAEKGHDVADHCRQVKAAILSLLKPSEEEKA